MLLYENWIPATRTMGSRSLRHESSLLWTKWQYHLNNTCLELLTFVQTWKTIYSLFKGRNQYQNMSILKHIWFSHNENMEINTTCYSVPGSTQLPIPWVPRACPSGPKQLCCKADHSLSPSAEVNAWNYIIPPLSFTMWCLIKHCNNFTWGLFSQWLRVH